MLKVKHYNLELDYPSLELAGLVYSNEVPDSPFMYHQTTWETDESYRTFVQAYYAQITTLTRELLHQYQVEALGKNSERSSCCQRKVEMSMIFCFAAKTKGVMGITSFEKLCQLFEEIQKNLLVLEELILILNIQHDYYKNLSSKVAFQDVQRYLAGEVLNGLCVKYLSHFFLKVCVIKRAFQVNNWPPLNKT